MAVSRKNFKLIIEYDGTPYSGWQVQPRRTTVQGEIQRALSTMLNQPITLIGSGRTDAGVHAMGQVAHFHADTALGGSEIKKGINCLIRGPIVIHCTREVPDDFHARFHARSKTYHYHILNRPAPCAVGRNYLWHIPRPLDTKAMDRCCTILQGAHDFKSFEGAGSPRAHTVRTIHSAEITVPGTGPPERLVFKITGNGFLRFMVRNIVGTLVQVGLSRLTPAMFQEILLARDRRAAAATAPARGLFLMKVSYCASSGSSGCNN